MTDGIDRDHFLDYSAKSKIFNLPKLSSCKGAANSKESAPRRTAVPPVRPAIRWSVRLNLQVSYTGQGVVVCSERCGLGARPELFDYVAAATGGGGDEETRTPDPLLAKEMLYQLSYVPGVRRTGMVVGVSGLEPETSALSGQCSNQLS